MDVNTAVAREGGRGREIVMYVLCGVLVESGDGKVTYEGGSRKCMVIREGIGVKELLKMVIFKGNDEHGYMYVAGNAGPVRQPHARVVVCESRVQDIGEGKQIARSGGKCNDDEEVGEESDNNEARVKRNSRSLGVEGGELRGSRLRLRGDTIEMSDDDEISIATEDAGDEEATKEDNAGDERAAEKQCSDRNKRKGCTDGNGVNDNVWPRSGMEAQSYHRKLSIWKKFQDFVYVVCPAGLQFSMYSRPAAEIFPNSLAHTHCAGIEYHGRYCAKPGCTCSCAQHSNNHYVHHRAAVYCVVPACCGDSPNLQAHIHCAGVLYHGRHYMKPG
ncbi:hypothetical protein Cgig2_018025 [Carnegiea gigantea]|uniref:Uncharacterized protein n=1 Tax=Carnegiea gigantea TaxID=171969 RepID=A0A9Q1JZ33_9CARY|nr:hypothetical protein Cgig2_018025 [Carnegiea gigantea]